MYKLKYVKNIYCKFILASMTIVLCSCSNTAVHREVIRQPQVHKNQETAKLVVKRALKDDVASEMYDFQLMKNSTFQKSIRNNTKIVVRRYPFSPVRKLDEFIIGAATAPFTPLAIIGGVVNDDPDLAFYPLSMLWPFRNFRPEKAGLLSGAVTPVEKVNIVEGNWQNIGQQKEVSLLRNSKFKVQVNGKEAIFHTNSDGVATINLSKVPRVFNDNGDLKLNIVINNSLHAKHNISSQRLIVVRAKKYQPQQETPLKEPAQDLTQADENLIKDLIVKEEAPIKIEEVPIKTEKETVELSQIIPAKKPAQLIPNTSNIPGMDRALLYKGLTHGYWIKKEDGFPIMALPNKLNTVLYETENLAHPNGSTLQPGKEFYVFAFSFTSDNKNIAVKVGTSPFENEAHGWGNSQDLFLWNTLNRVRATKSFAIYRTHDDCLRGNDKSARVFEVNDANSDLYFPVLERKGSVWCIAYPDENNNLKHGWIQWLSETGLQVEVRAMKHKIDMAINYLAKKVIIKAQDLEKQYTMELRGPLYLLKPKENMVMSSFVREKESTKITKARQIEAPEDEKEFEAFHQQVQELGKILTEKEVWETDDDVIYIPAERD